MTDTTHDFPITATLGFAAGGTGGGVGYVELAGADDRQSALVRVVFRCRPLPALRGRDVAYAALDAAAAQLLRRGLRNVELRLDDEALALDVAEHRPVPAALTIPYVRLRCVLNRFACCRVRAVQDRTTRDLGARARAEVSLDVAA